MAKYLSNINLNGNQLQNAAIHPSGTAPTITSTGQLYYNTSAGGASGLKVYDGSAWVSVGDIQSVTSATTSQLTVANENGPSPEFSIVTGAVTASGTALATGAQITTYVEGYADPAGTDNSTNVTLITTSHDYLSISGQEITLGAISLADDTTGTLAIARGGTGQTTAAAAANALLNTSQGGSLSIGDSSDTITVPGNFVVTGTTTYLNESIQIVENNTISFEGATVDAFEVKLTSADATLSDKTITLPDATGTVALTSDIGDATITIEAGDALTGGGTFDTNDSGASTITINHADTSSQASVDNSNLAFVQDISLDTYGHITSITSTDATAQVNTLIDTKINATKYSATIGNGVLTSIPIDAATHGLGADSSYFMIQTIQVSTGETVFCDVTRGASGLITFDFATAPASNDIRVVVFA
jgi:hypothetical protein